MNNLVQKPLRPYQEQAIQTIADAIPLGRRTGILNLATGMGKTFTIIKATERLWHPSTHRTCFIAPARSLVWQLNTNLQTDFPAVKADYHLNHTHYPGLGVVMGKFNDYRARVITSSLQTILDKVELDHERNRNPITKSDIVVDRYGNVRKQSHSKRRVLVSQRFDRMIKEAGLFQTYIFDEAHHSVAPETLRMFNRIKEIHEILDVPPPNIIGLTATPLRWDGVALANLYETIYFQRSYRWAQRNGYLAPFADPIQINILSDMLSQEGTVNVAENWDDMVYEAWKDVAFDRQCIGFTASIGSESAIEVAHRLAKYFTSQGVPAAAIDGQGCINEYGDRTPVSDRGRIFDAFMQRKIRVLFMYGVGLEGLDLPVADCLLWLRRTENVVLMTQAIGRILRKHPGKEDALLVDFTGNGLSVSPMGTLMGLMVNPDEIEEPDEIDEEDLLEPTLDGISLLDLKSDDTVVADGISVKVGKIINKQGHDWFPDGDTNSLSLQVNKSNVLLIKQPNYSLQQKARDYLAIATEIETSFSEGGVYDNVQKALNSMPERKRKDWIQLFQWLYQYAGAYTLWHILVDYEKSTLVNDGYIADNSSLDMLMLSAARYSVNHIQNHQSFLMDRSSKWSGKATNAQRLFLKRLGHSEAEVKELRMKEANQLISHTLAYRAIRGYEEKINKFLATLESGKEE